MSKKLPEILITKQFPEEIIEPLKSVATVHQWDAHEFNLMPREVVLEKIGRLSAIINQAELKVDRELLEKGKKLKIIANVSIGVDNMDLNLMSDYGVWGTNTPGYFDYPVAEYVIGGMISIMRRLPEANAYVRASQWDSFQPGRWDGESLRGKTLGIIGMGNIGQSVGRLAEAFGMHILCYDIRNSSENKCVPLDILLSKADVISAHVPHTPDTDKMFNSKTFGQMKPGVIFVNASRGNVVDQKHLAHELKKGHVGGAVLDVFEKEPEVPDAMKSMSNVLLTPHIAGGTKSGRIECYKMAVQNVLQVISGNKPDQYLNNPLLK